MGYKTRQTHSFQLLSVHPYRHWGDNEDEKEPATLAHGFGGPRTVFWLAGAHISIGERVAGELHLPQLDRNLLHSNNFPESTIRNFLATLQISLLTRAECSQYPYT